MDSGNLVILTNGFGKKSQKTPPDEISRAEKYEKGYEEFKVDFLLKELKKKEEMTQEELAIRLKTKKSVISRMENHTEDIRLSTIGKVADNSGRYSDVK